MLSAPARRSKRSATCDLQIAACICKSPRVHRTGIIRMKPLCETASTSRTVSMFRMVKCTATETVRGVREKLHFDCTSRRVRSKRQLNFHSPSLVRFAQNTRSSPGPWPTAGIFTETFQRGPRGGADSVGHGRARSGEKRASSQEASQTRRPVFHKPSTSGNSHTILSTDTQSTCDGFLQ
jgi:hypothetical protein